MLPIQPLDLSDSANNALRNLSDKPTAIAGNIIADFLSVPASKVHYWAQKHIIADEQNFNLFINSVSQKLSAIPDNKAITPQLQLLSSVSEDVAHCVNSQELCEMFASLLSNSCNIDYSSFVHPSFSTTLKQMSPYDAQLFKKLCSNTISEWFAAEYIVLTNNSSNYSLLHECIISVDEPFTNFDMQSMSVSALKHLGLITYSESEPYSPGDAFENCEYFRNLLNEYSGTDSQPVARRVGVCLTPYGESFARVCLDFPNFLISN